MHQFSFKVEGKFGGKKRLILENWHLKNKREFYHVVTTVCSVIEIA